VNYCNTVFIGQSIYVLNIQNNWLTIFSPGKATPTTISPGCLHSWDSNETVALGIPRKQANILPERSSRKQKICSETLQSPPVTQTSFVILWVLIKINCIRRMFKRSPAEPTTHVDSIAKRVEAIETEGKF
jgi:hypothetical protein